MEEVFEARDGVEPLLGALEEACRIPFIIDITRVDETTVCGICRTLSPSTLLIELWDEVTERGSGEQLTVPLDDIVRITVW